MLEVTDEAREKLLKMIERERPGYFNRNPKLLKGHTIAIALYESHDESLSWELFATITSWDMPSYCFLEVNGVLFHDPEIYWTDARVDYSNGKLSVNGQSVRLIPRQCL
ncbi:hypothetical protein [Aliikangiella sp. IMCC44359]|uniref:hypothetical protein n=1 Tax=Aliikangiella sp. IMCC44359 TaxID=3459125 RepID=UPI00403AB33F